MSEQRNLIPEVKIIFDVYRPVTDKEKRMIKKGINDKVQEVFGQQFDVKYVELIIELEEGSLKINILVAIASLYMLISNYGSARSGLDYLASDLRVAFKNIVPIVRQVVGEQNIRYEIKTEERLGAIAELDELIHRYQSHDLTRDEYMQRAEHVLEQINQSEDREKLVRAMCGYIESRYGQEFWEELASGLETE